MTAPAPRQRPLLRKDPSPPPGYSSHDGALPDHAPVPLPREAGRYSRYCTCTPSPPLNRPTRFGRVGGRPVGRVGCGRTWT